MRNLKKTVAEIQEDDWEDIRLKLFLKLSQFDNPADREDAAHDALIRLAAELSDASPDDDLLLLIHVAARREIDHCSPQHSYTLPNGKRRVIRGTPVYRPLYDSADLAELILAEDEDDADGINQPRDWQALSNGEIVEAGLVSAKRERIAG